MAFDNPAFGRKNYEEYLRNARETLTLEYLTADDKSIIERGIYYLVRGDDLLKGDDPESLREAAWLFLAGGYYLGGRCLVSDSEKEYWRRKSNAKGGEAEDAPQQQRKVWQDYVRECLAKNSKISTSILVDSLLVDKTAPKCLPRSREYLLKEVRNIKKAMEAAEAPGERDILRLVQGGKA
jgi:hypothetical protein